MNKIFVVKINASYFAFFFSSSSNRYALSLFCSFYLCCRLRWSDERARRVEEDCIEPTLLLLVRLSPLPLLLAAFLFETQRRRRRGRRRRRRRKGSLREQRPSRARCLRRGCGGGPASQGHAPQAREPSSPHCQKGWCGSCRARERERRKRGEKKVKLLPFTVDWSGPLSRGLVKPSKCSRRRPHTRSLSLQIRSAAGTTKIMIAMMLPSRKSLWRWYDGIRRREEKARSKRAVACFPPPPHPTHLKMCISHCECLQPIPWCS